MQSEFIHTPYEDKTVIAVMDAIMHSTTPAYRSKEQGGYFTNPHTFVIPSENFPWSKMYMYSYESRKRTWADVKSGDQVTLVAHGDVIWSSYIKWKVPGVPKDEDSDPEISKTWFSVDRTRDFLLEKLGPAIEKSGGSIRLNINITACISAKGGMFGKSFCFKLARSLGAVKGKPIQGRVVGYPGIVYDGFTYSGGVYVSGTGRTSALARYFTGLTTKNRETLSQRIFPIP